MRHYNLVVLEVDKFTFSKTKSFCISNKLKCIRNKQYQRRPKRQFMMQGKSNLQKRLQELRQRKDALHALQNDVQTHVPPPSLQQAPRPPERASLQSQSRNSTQAQQQPQPSRNKLRREKRASVDIPPASAQHRPRHARGKGPHSLPDIVGQVGRQPTLTPIPQEDSPIANAPDDTVNGQDRVHGAPLHFRCRMSDAVATAMRPVTAMRFHSKHDDVILSAHAARTDGQHGAAEGIVNVWALHGAAPVLQRSLFAPAAITALEHFQISPTLVVAATSVGSILLWDMRAPSALPITALKHLQTDVSDCHGRRSVTSLRTTAASSPFFVTTSAAGHVCTWSLSQPDRPLTQGVLRDANVSDRLYVSASDLPASTSLSSRESKVVVRAPAIFAGCLQGSVVRAEADGRVWRVAAERGMHSGAVTTVRAHPAALAAPALDDVVASAAYDWCVRVWAMRAGAPCRPLWRFDNVCDGVVHDVAWGTVHPSVLCAGDDNGILSVFDVSGRLRHPTTAKALWRFAPPEAQGRAPISALAWGWNDQLLCAGDNRGDICAWATTSSLASLPDAEWLGQYFKSKAAQSDG